MSLSTKTPATPTQLPRRSLTRPQALRSVSQVREAAKHLRKSDLKPYVSSDPLTPSATPNKALITKPKTPKALPKREMKFQWKCYLNHSINQVVCHL